MNLRRLWMVGLAIGVCVSSAVEARPQGTLRVMLLNGGMSPKKNYESHLVHLEKMRAALDERGIEDHQLDVFMSDGGKKKSDLAVRDTVDSGLGWLLEETDADALLPRVRLIDTPWTGPQSPATREALGEWFQSAPLTRGDTLYFYATDHGYRDQEEAQSGLWLWDQQMTPAEFGGLLDSLDDGVKAVLVMSQCYSGAFAEVAWAAGPPSGEVCGFFSTNAYRPAYGCYPDGRAREIGHGFRFVDALAGAQTLAQANQWVVLADRSPDVPLSTSDLYLEHLVQEAAAQDGVPPDVFADTLLADASSRGRWQQTREPLDAIGQAFGMRAPDRLAELVALDEQIEQMQDTLGDAESRWTRVRKQATRDNFAALVAVDPEWSQALDTLPRKRKKRAVLRDALIADLTNNAQTRQTWRQLQDLHEQEVVAHDIAWRLRVRAAAVLRMRAVLMRAAGEELIRQSRMSAEKRGLRRLQTCEATSLGPPPQDAMPPLPAPYPSMAEEARNIARVLPSFLGIRFDPIAAAGAPGAVQVKAVSPDSPAERAGIQVGDVLTGPPGQPFQTPFHISAWVALADRGQNVQLAGRRNEQPVQFSIQLMTPNKT